MYRPGDRMKDLKTLAVPAGALLLLGLLARRPGPALAGAALFGAGLISARFSAGLAGWWMAFAEACGRFNGRVALGAVYFLFLTPLALLARLLGGNPMRAGFDPAAKSYFHATARRFVPSDLEKPW
jgi:hypothetical protein